MDNGSISNRGDRRQIISWALYDFANSSFTTLVVTFIFSVYFTQRIATSPEHGTILWSRAVNVSALIAALITPLLGAIADHSARKKFFLLVTTVQCIVFTTLLFFVGPGETTQALLFFVIANIGFEAGYVFYNAFLPEISTPQTIGRVSGIGQAMGYAGGLLCLFIALGMVRGGWPGEGDLPIRATNLLVAVWFLIFCIPAFLYLKEPVRSGGLGIVAATQQGFQRLRVTFGRLRSYREVAKLLLAHLVYNDGLVTVFSFASIFAAAVFGMTTKDLIILGIALNVAAALGSLAFGFLNDRIGGKRTITITLVALIIATIWGASAQSVGGFWAAAILLGIMVGPNQSASRSLLGVLVPENKHGEFFGFFAFSGKLASLLGPLLYGTVVQVTGSQRWAMGSIIVFFFVGLILLQFVREKEGIELAASESAEGRQETS